jgi:uncharacterized protein (TIGR02270 family)
MLPTPDAVPLPPDLAEVPSGQGFRIGLYLEHLEEAAALWEQRPADRLNPDLSWLDLADDEGRLEAHLDALVLGGDLALAVCHQRSVGGDAGELHAALRVFCRRNRPDLVQQAIEAVDPDDAVALDAVCDALVPEMPDAWEAGVWRPGRIDDPRWLRLAAALVAHRQRPGRDALLRALPGAPAGVRPAVVRALGRTADGVPEPALAALLHDDEAAVRVEAGVALLRAGTPSGQEAALPAIRDDDALIPLLALAGRPSAVAWLRARLAAPDAPTGVALTLGLLGDPAAVPDLIGALGAAPEAAALALHVLTGADLRGETFVPDVPEDDELFDDELFDDERGDHAAPPDADPRGTTVAALSTDPEAWQAWWSAHESAFAAGTRYRLGWPAGPASQVASLAAPSLPHAARAWVAEELAVRYRMPVAFDATWSVARQQTALAEMRAWADQQAFVPGRWYAGGHYAGLDR